MKNYSKLFLVTTFTAASLASARRPEAKPAAKLAAPTDFIPMTVWDATANAEAPLEDNGIGVGWNVTDPGEVLDYGKINSDATEANRVWTLHQDDGKIQNVLYNVRNNKIIAVLGRGGAPKDTAFNVCFQAAELNSNHRDCEVNYDPKSGFAVFEVEGRWDTVNIEALRLKKDLSAPSSQTNLTGRVGRLFDATLVKRYGSDPKFKALPNGTKSLTYTFTAKKLVPADANSATVFGTADAGVPKADDSVFSASIQGKVKLVEVGNQVSVKTLPQN